MKIIVIDDDTDFLATVKPFLKRKGYDVAVSPSCDDGISLLSSFKPEFIFLDINVGDQDGRELCKKIKASAEFRHIPVILISANHQDLALYPKYGAEAGIKKPFQLSILLAMLKKDHRDESRHQL